MRLFLEVRLVAHVVLVETSDDLVTVIGNQPVQLFLGRTHPVALFPQGRFIRA